MSQALVKVSGDRVGERFELVAPLGGAGQGQLWRGLDRLADSAPVALRCLRDRDDQQRFKALWPSLQGLLHPQIPRFGGLMEEGEDLWLVREWQEGRTYAELLKARAERQMVFGAGEVLLLLRQFLPVLILLHRQRLVHADLNPTNLLRRERDGLPVLLDVGLLQRVDGVAAGRSATSGYAPAAQGRGEPLAAWMDLHALGTTALVLLSGEAPQQLLNPRDLSWCLPGALDEQPQLRQTLERLVCETPGDRFGSAAEALNTLQAIPVPDSTGGPVARADRTVVLAPVAVAPVPVMPPPTPGQRVQERDQAAEGRLWPVTVALLLSALVGIAVGWWLLIRGEQAATTGRTPAPEVPSIRPTSLPPAEVDPRQALLSRLQAMQVDRNWFLSLVNASLMERFPERQGRPPTGALADAPLRQAWNELAEEWMARVELLPPDLRARLGRFSDRDWQKRRGDLEEQGISAEALVQLVSSSADGILPQLGGNGRPAEPFRQLWYVAAEQRLATVDIERINARINQPLDLSTRVKGRGARLVSISVPERHHLVLGVNGSPLMRMTVFGADGQVLEPDGPLRIAQLPVEAGSPVQVLITNEGVSSGLINLSCHAGPAPAAAPDPSATPGLRAPPRTPAGQGSPAPSRQGDHRDESPSEQAGAADDPPILESPPAPNPSIVALEPSEALQR